MRRKHVSTVPSSEFLHGMPREAAGSTLYRLAFTSKGRASVAESAGHFYFDQVRRSALVRTAQRRIDMVRFGDARSGEAKEAGGSSIEPVLLPPRLDFFH